MCCVVVLRFGWKWDWFLRWFERFVMCGVLWKISVYFIVGFVLVK